MKEKRWERRDGREEMGEENQRNQRKLQLLE